MKRLFVVILAFIYIVTTTGITMHMHFCMGKMAGWSLWNKYEDKVCGQCGMDKSDQPNGCCSDDAKWFKIDDDQKAALASYDFSPVSEAGFIKLSGLEQKLFYSESADLLPKNHAPPYFSPIALYTQYCVFRI